MPGPAWYSSQFDQTLHMPAGEITAAAPLQWGTDTPVTTGQVGGGPWIISKHSKNIERPQRTSSSGPRRSSTRPARTPGAAIRRTSRWRTSGWRPQASNPYFAADPGPALKAAASQIWTGWNLVTYPDQPVWSNTVVTQLVAGKSLSSLLQPFGDALTQAAKAAGYDVVQQLTRLASGCRAPGIRAGHASSVACADGGASRSSCRTCRCSSSSASCRWSTHSTSRSRPTRGASPAFGNFIRTVDGLPLRAGLRARPGLHRRLAHPRWWCSSSPWRCCCTVGPAGPRRPFGFLYYLPGALAGAASVLVWLFMLDPSVSPGSFLLRHVLGADLFVESIAPGHLPFIFAMIAFWTGAGGWIVVMYGALNTIPHELEEAARIDGAGPFTIALRTQAAADPQVDRLHGDPVLRDRDAALRRAAARQPGEPRSGPGHLVVQPARLSVGLPIRRLQRGRRDLRRPAG